MTHEQKNHTSQPIIFHLGRDPGEKYPIGVKSAEYKSAWQELKKHVDEHKSSLNPAKPQLNYCDGALMVRINQSEICGVLTLDQW